MLLPFFASCGHTISSRRFLPSGDNPSPSSLPPEGLACPVPGHVPVDPGNGGGGEKIAERRVNRFVLLQKFRPAAERILLVVRLGRVEPGGRKDFGVDPPVSPGGFAALRPYRQVLLLVIVGKNRGHVLPSPGTLPRIVACPEDIEQFPVRDHGRIELHLDRLDMVPEVVIRRVLRRPTRVSDTGAKDSGKTPEPGVRTPESAQGEGRRLRRPGGGCIHRGDRRGSGRRPVCHLAFHFLPLRSRMKKYRAPPWNRCQEMRRDQPRRCQSKKDRPIPSPEREHRPLHR